MKVVASIVTYNSKKIIDGVLCSLKETITESCSMEIIVVDNGSSDNTVEYISKNYPDVKIVKSRTNCGYGSGNNQALRMSSSDYFFIINPDITFDKELIQRAVDYMEKHPEVVLVNPDIKGPDGRRKYPPKALPRIHYIIPRVLKWNNKVFNKWRDEYTYKSRFVEVPFEVEVCSGSFMICRTKALVEVGGFDERYFLYYEDLDLSRKMALRGKIECNPELIVYHIGAKEAYHSRSAKKHMVKSMIKYYNKWGWKI